MQNNGFKVILYLFWMALLVSALQLARFLLQDPNELTTLTHQQLVRDLQRLEQQLLSYSAFATFNPNLATELQQQRQVIEQRYPKQISRFQLSAEVAKLVARLNDPGASVANWRSGARLPTALQAMGKHWLALNQQQQPLDAEHPFITHIDGLPISRWRSAAKQFLPANAAPEQLTQLISHTYLLRQQIGLPDRANVRLTLSDLQHDAVSIDLPLLAAKRKLQQPISRWRLLSPQVQLIRSDDLDLFERNRQLRNDLQHALAANTLVVDLRHADGMSNALLALLASNHETPSSQPSGYGRYKRHPQLRNDALAAYGYWPLSQFALFPTVRARLLNATNNELSDFYGRPPLVNSQHARQTTEQQLLLLLGPGCRHECEWLAHAAKRWPNTLLLGSNTSGDYGRRHHFRLPASNLAVQVSSSLAYDRYGNLLSGIGTEVDIAVDTQREVDWPLLLKTLRDYRRNCDSNDQKTPSQTQTKPR